MVKKSNAAGVVANLTGSIGHRSKSLFGGSLSENLGGISAPMGHGKQTYAPRGGANKAALASRTGPGQIKFR